MNEMNERLAELEQSWRQKEEGKVIVDSVLLRAEMC